MLGPALTHLLEVLAEIPTRTEDQQALFTELSLLFAAFPRNEADEQHKEAGKRLRERHNIHTFSYTKPYTGPYKPKTKCHKCSQYFPVSTQPP
jgi:hypothetical protein